MKFFLLFLTLFLTTQAHSRTLVLVHGFMSDSASWRTSSFTKPLQFTGWTDGGNYNFSPWGMLTPNRIMADGDVFFTVDLPSTQNLQRQEVVLSQYLQHLYQYRVEPITLVGHSAGGVVARLYVLDPQRQPVNALITIASPHRGTPVAKVARLAGNSPIGMIASMAGADELQDSRGLFSDLKEETPYNFLYWMNHQPHPDIHYASIIRRNDKISKPNKFDFFVPPNSQNMNKIWALRNRSGIALTTEDHAINGKDGRVLVDILKYVQ